MYYFNLFNIQKRLKRKYISIFLNAQKNVSFLCKYELFFKQKKKKKKKKNW